MIKSVLITLLSVFSFASINILENSNSIIIEANQLSFDGSFYNSVFSSYSKSNKSYSNLQFRLALKEEFIEEVSFNKQKINYNIRNIGEINNIPHIELTLFPTNLRLPSKFTFKLNLNLDFELLNKQKLDPLFNLTINKKQLGGMIQVERHKKSINKQTDNQESWLDPSRNYAKVSVQEDGIYKIECSDIIAILGQGISLDEVSVFYNGNHYPYFYIDSDDDILTIDDKFYLLGERQKGDTTNFDFYTNKSNYYVTTGLQENKLVLSQLSTVNNRIDLVNQKFIIEQENIYKNGLTGIDYQTNAWEGWYEESMLVVGTNDASYDRHFFLPFSDNSSAIIDIYYAHNVFSESTIINSEKLNNKYNIDFFINGIFDFNTGPYNLLDYDEELFWAEEHSIQRNFISGINNLKITNKFTQEGEIADLLFDRLEVEAKIPPIAYSDKIEFSIKKEDNVEVNIQNFSSDRIIAIDTLNNLIDFPETKPELSVSASNNSFWTSLRIGNEIYTSDTKSIHFLALEGKINDGSFSSGTVSETNIDDFIDDLEKYDVFAISINSKPSDQVIDKFLDIGFNVIDNCVFVSDGQIIYQDNKQSNAIVNTSYDLDLNSYSAKIESFPIANWIINSENSIPNYSIYEVSIDQEIRNFEDNTELVLIYHSKFSDYATSYKEYQEEKGYKIKLVNVEQIYDEFSYGRKSPHSIKKYLEYIYYNIPDHPKHIYFVGDASKDPFKRLNKSIADDYIPSYGVPVSDNWFAEIDSENGNRFKFIITRLPLNNIEYGVNFLDKVKNFESQNKSPWMKEFLVLTGGRSNDYLSLFDRSRDMFENLIDNEFCVDTILITKFLDGEPNELPSLIQNEINNGKIWTNFIGHGSVNSVDLGGWNSFNLNNKDRMGIVSTVSCNTGEFANPQIQNSRNEDLIFSKEKGFVGAFGGSTTGYEDLSSIKMQIMMNYLRDINFAIRRPSEILFAAIERRDIDENIKMTYNYLGDPLLELPISKREDYFFINNSFKINSSEDSFISVGDESVNIEFEVFNLGYNLSNPNIRIIRSAQGFKDTINQNLNPVCGSNRISLELPILNIPGTHDLVIEIDPEGNSLETDRNDNILNESFEVFAGNIIILDPQNNWNLDPNEPRIRFLNLNKNDSENFTLKLLDENEQVFYNYDVSSTLSKIDIDLTEVDNFDKTNFIVYGNDLFNNKVRVHLNEINKPDVNHKIIANDVLDFEGATLSDNRLELINKEVDFIVESHLTDENFLPNSVFKFNNKVIENEGFHGYTIVEISKSTGEFQINRFNTRGDYSVTPPVFEKDDTKALIDFLQNKIDRDNNYYLIASSGEANNIPLNICEDDNTCSAAILIQELVNLGSEAYSFSGLTLDQTYIMVIGDSFQESLNFSESSMVSGDFEFDYAEFKLKTEQIKFVKKWKQFVINGSIQESEYFLNAISNLDTTLFKSNENVFDISSLKSSEYNFELTIKTNDINSYLESVEVIFESVPEIALIADPTQGKVLRGDSLNLNYKVDNYSLRSKAENLEIKSFDGDSQLNSKTLTIIDADRQAEFDINNNSINFRSTTQLFLELNQGFKEINVNNNFIRINTGVFEDTIVPSINVYIDSVLVNSYDYIALNPEIVIDVYDNSRLPFNGVDNLKLIRINGPFNKDSVEVEEGFDFDQTNGLKARYRITDHNKFVIGETQSNFLDLVITDASSNEAKLFHYYNIAHVGRLDNLFNYPNPFSEKTTITFELQNPDNLSGKKGLIYIYNSTGRLIKTIETELNNGINEVVWDGLSEDGNTNSSGFYYYVVVIKSIEPNTGKMFKSN